MESPQCSVFHELLFYEGANTVMGVSLFWWTRGDSVPDHYVVRIEPTPSSRRRSTPHWGDEFDCSNLPGIEVRGPPKWVYLFIGGPEEIRTPDPYNANVMRSQLRYGPISLSESRTIITLIHRNVKENLVPY